MVKPEDIRSYAIDVAGLALVGAAIYGLVTGKVQNTEFAAIITAASLWLGVRLPTG